MSDNTFEISLHIDPQEFAWQFEWLLQRADGHDDGALEGLLNMMGGIRDELEDQGAVIRPAGDTPMRGTVRDWYVEAYPTDELGAEINAGLTFEDAYTCLGVGDIYDALGVVDSVVRERVFGEISERLDVDCGHVYDKWLGFEPAEDIERGPFAGTDDLSEMLDAASRQDPSKTGPGDDPR